MSYITVFNERCNSTVLMYEEGNEEKKEKREILQNIQNWEIYLSKILDIDQYYYFKKTRIFGFIKNRGDNTIDFKHPFFIDKIDDSDSEDYTIFEHPPDSGKSLDFLRYNKFQTNPYIIIYEDQFAGLYHNQFRKLDKELKLWVADIDSYYKIYLGFLDDCYENPQKLRDRYFIENEKNYYTWDPEIHKFYYENIQGVIFSEYHSDIRNFFLAFHDAKVNKIRLRDFKEYLLFYKAENPNPYRLLPGQPFFN